MVEAHLEPVWNFIVIGFTFLALIGFSLIEAGVSRTIHGPVILVKNLLQISIGITLFWIFGYGFSMGEVDGGFIGIENFAGEDFTGTAHYTKCAMFGLFGLVAVFTINGSIMERAQFWVYIWMSTIVMVWIYPVMVAWNWGGGWLSEFDVPVIDQGGAGPIHILGGITGLFGTALLLPRIGRFEAKEQVAHLFEKSVKIRVKPTDFDWGYPFLATVGAMFVWLGLSFINAALAPSMIRAG
jgi:Amt family ammonium transporter